MALGPSRHIIFRATNQTVPPRLSYPSRGYLGALAAVPRNTRPCPLVPRAEMHNGLRSKTLTSSSWQTEVQRPRTKAWSSRCQSPRINDLTQISECEKRVMGVTRGRAAIEDAQHMAGPGGGKGCWTRWAGTVSVE